MPCAHPAQLRNTPSPRNTAPRSSASHPAPRHGRRPERACCLWPCPAGQCGRTARPRGLCAWPLPLCVMLPRVTRAVVSSDGQESPVVRMRPHSAPRRPPRTGLGAFLPLGACQRSGSGPAWADVRWRVLSNLRGYLPREYIIPEGAPVCGLTGAPVCGLTEAPVCGLTGPPCADRGSCDGRPQAPTALPPPSRHSVVPAGPRPPVLATRCLCDQVGSFLHPTNERALGHSETGQTRGASRVRARLACRCREW